MPSQATTFDFDAARLAMVEGQIRPNHVANPALLDRFESVPRELFAAPARKLLAYSESDCAVNDNASRTMLAPMVLARLLDALDLATRDRLLIVGGGSGYSTAITAGLAGAVTLYEADGKLAELARRNCETLGLRNVTVKAAAMGSFPATLGTYTKIFIDGAVATVPDTLLNALEPDGRLLAIVCQQNNYQLGAATLFTKVQGAINHTALFEAAGGYLPGFAPSQGFSF